MDVWEMWDGWQWRRNRDLEVVGRAVALIQSMLKETDANKVTRSLPGYETSVEDFLRAERLLEDAALDMSDEIAPGTGGELAEG